MRLAREVERVLAVRRRDALRREVAGLRRAGLRQMRSK